MDKKNKSCMKKYQNYVAKEEYKTTLKVLKNTAKVIDNGKKVVQFFQSDNGKKVINILSTRAPKIFNAMSKASKIAVLLGPAGMSVGVAVDLLAAFGLIQDAQDAKLDEIIRKIDKLQNTVDKGFTDMKNQLKLNEIMLRFFNPYDKLKALTEQYELALYNKKDGMYYFIMRINNILNNVSIEQMLLLIRQVKNVLEGDSHTPNLFNTIINKAAINLQGDDFDKGVSAVCLKFQEVLSIIFRSIKMIRTCITIKQQDTQYEPNLCELMKFYANLIKLDPANKFKNYLTMKAYGGTFKLMAKKWPTYAVYMKDSKDAQLQCWHDVNKVGDAGVFKITPLPKKDDKGLFYHITNKKWPNYFVYMQDNSAGNIKGWKGNPGIQGEWKLSVHNFSEKSQNFTFTLAPKKWLDHNIYIQNKKKGLLYGWKGDIGDEGHFVLIPQITS